MNYDWSDDANCKGQTSVFFYDPRNAGDSDLARTICAECSCRAECLDFAINTNEPQGIWGGMAPFERDRERARRVSEQPT